MHVVRIGKYKKKLSKAKNIVYNSMNCLHHSLWVKCKLVTCAKPSCSASLWLPTLFYYSHSTMSTPDIGSQACKLYSEKLEGPDWGHVANSFVFLLSCKIAGLCSELQGSSEVRACHELIWPQVQ